MVFMLLVVASGHKVNTDTMLSTSFGLFLQVIVSDPCFLKWVLSLAHRSSRSPPVLNLCASLENIPSVRFKWVVAAFVLLDRIWVGCGKLIAWGSSDPDQLWLGFPPTQASFPHCPSTRPPIVGCFALILEDDDGDGIPRLHAEAVDAGANRGATGAGAGLVVFTADGFDSFNRRMLRSSSACVFESFVNSAVTFSSFKSASSNLLSPLSSSGRSWRSLCLFWAFVSSVLFLSMLAVDAFIELLATRGSGSFVSSPTAGGGFVVMFDVLSFIWLS